MLGEDPAGRAALAARHPIGRMAVPEDVAHLVLYLASDESTYMSGSVITFDGGWTAR
jgi:NAD(P)-dependent dehydrogenase (short-subunit alcohol dehydrogenase family)